MPRFKMLGFALPPIILITAMIGVPGLRDKKQDPVTRRESKVFDESRFPIADFTAPAPTDPAEWSKRRVRARKYDKSAWSVNPDAVSDSTVRVDFVDLKLPAFPIRLAQAIVIGTVTDAKAYLSNDKTGIYSVFTVSVDEVLQNSSRVSLAHGTLIEGERQGGRVKFPSGRVHLYMTTEQNMPQVGQRYVLFLTDGNDEPVFEILTGYEMREGTVYPLDQLPQSRLYEKANELRFLSELRTKIANP